MEQYMIETKMPGQMLMLKKIIALSIIMLLCLIYVKTSFSIPITETEAIHLVVEHISEITQIPTSVLTLVTAPSIYDAGKDWYIVLYYHEPPEVLDEYQIQDKKNNLLILFSAFINKESGEISDAPENNIGSLSSRIEKYRGGKLTFQSYLGIVKSWEALFGLSYYWTYDLYASFELLYGLRPQVRLYENVYVNNNTDDYPLIYGDIPLYVFPAKDTITYQEAMSKAKEALPIAFPVTREELDEMEYASEYCINNNASVPFDFSKKYSNKYWRIVFYYNDDEYLLCTILDDGTIEELVLCTGSDYLSCHIQEDGTLIYR